MGLKNHAKYYDLSKRLVKRTCLTQNITLAVYMNATFITYNQIPKFLMLRKRIFVVLYKEHLVREPPLMSSGIFHEIIHTNCDIPG